jgi:2-keto-4-pentenoate hydratase/2-oxohepta-3-ene-1,7-dioic acid hydratase in catechol pathway
VGEKPTIGAELGKNGDIVDLRAGDPSLPSTSVEFIQEGAVALNKANKVITSGSNVLKRSTVQLLAPVTKQDKVVCVGNNYKDHCEEQGIPLPEEPVIFNKFPSTIIGPYDDIQHPTMSDAVDWEVEFVIVIGKTGKNIKPSEALDHVFGYTVGHDVSARDWQLGRNGGQWLLGKSMDTSCPLGPVIVTKDDIKDPHNLKLSTRVNGVEKQKGNTKELVHKPEHLIAHVSKFVTLYPGDIILTGTPPGVGCFRKPPEYLKRGDVVECEIEHIGVLRNKVV